MFTIYYYLFIFLHHLFLLPHISANSPPYTPTDCILLNCGTPSNVTLPDGREWDTDSPYTLNTQTTTISTASDIDPSIDKIPYSTARIFHSKFTYTFNVSSPGQKFLRLYFYPTDYSPFFDKTQSFFSVDAADHTLLSNFSAFRNLRRNLSTMVKEYIVTVNQTNLLELTFTPSPKSYAFINGIELVSIPENFYIKGHDNDDLNLFLNGETQPYNIDNSTALETLYRLNVGDFSISPTHDTGMFRSWSEDDEYLYDNHFGLKSSPVSIPINYTSKTPAYTAPDIVYANFRTTDYKQPHNNLTWKFEVDSGFYYLLRLYFCQTDVNITEPGVQVFFIIINNITVENTADVIEWSGGYGTPVYRDYVVFCTKRDLWLAMSPNTESTHSYNVILNGLEIFKLGPSGVSLAAPNPEVSVAPSQEPKQVLPAHKNSGVSSTLIGGVAGGAVGGVILIGALLLILWRRRGGLSRESSMWDPLSYANSKSTNTNASSLPSVRSRRFSLEEIKTATSNFDDTFIIGIGGFGNVYKGYIDKGTITVAIKRLNPLSRQGAQEFRTEIEMLSHLRHLHLVSLIGYCDDNGEMILVYDYMAHGTLRSHLYRGDNPPLSWKQRLHICIGAAKGLHYLHADAERVIIHRDIKSTNILLDDKMVAKVSDFGLSKLGPSDTVGHVSTNVKGSFGYWDPEYFRTQQLTTKSDVYSFGVVLFEVLCARQALKPELPKEEVNLAEWARNCYKKDRLGEIVDQNLKGEIAEESLKIYGELGFNCLKDQGIDRPTMSDVVWSLEFALQLQESNENLGNKVVVDSDYQMIHIDSDDEASYIGAKDKNDHSFSSESVGKSKGSGTSITTSSSDGFKSGSVFSEILNPNVR